METVDNRFRAAKSAKAEENQAECTDAQIFEKRRGQVLRPKFYKRLANATCGILAQCLERIGERVIAQATQYCEVSFEPIKKDR